MALSATRRPLFSQRWVDGLAPIAESAMSAIIRVFIPGQGRVYDVDTDTWTNTPDTVLYTGPARVQPIRSAREARATGDSTTVQSIRFQVPVSSGLTVRPDTQVRVTACTLSPALLTYQYVIRDTAESSNPFEITFEATVNNETVV